MTVYLVAKYINEHNWKICGIYTKEEIAIDNCFDENYFYHPFELDESIDNKIMKNEVTFPYENWIDDVEIKIGDK